MRVIILITAALLCLSCTPTEDRPTSKETPKTVTPKFEQTKADYLYKFAFECIDKEYPNKLGQVIGDASYLKPPKELHPAFYGCFDWHSSVHGHWTLVNIVERFPRFEKNKEIVAKLSANITKENIAKEVFYFDDKLNVTYERTYGWAWLLKLAEALKDSKNPEFAKMAENLEPLTARLSKQLIEFLPKLNYPIRVGEHTNTAFGLSFALDYARKYDKNLEEAIVKRSKEYYQNDKACPLNWEPSGFDFLSPCLQEASLMNKVLEKNEFSKWLDTFLPGFEDDPAAFLRPAEVTDRSDGKLAHLDGLNFSRAWCLYEIGRTTGNKDIVNTANLHLAYSYEKIDSGEYAGTHWLASFAAYALVRGNENP
jgi:hypothetical protein